jgi:pyruvate dehydrogenase kinase 2/3/4
VCIGKEDLSIKISDEGGGMTRGKMDSMFTFASTTLTDDDVVDEIFPTTLPGGGDMPTKKHVRGFGLPLSRIYARYFGGDLFIKTLEGHGVDAYLHLPVFGKGCENLSDAVAKSPGNVVSGESVEDMTWEVLLQKRAL